MIDPQEMERLVQLRMSLLERQTVYSYCASWYGKRYYIFTIPSLMITTTISVLGAVWPYEGDLAIAGRIIISVLAALGTIITAILSLFKFQSKMDSFAMA